MDLRKPSPQRNDTAEFSLWALGPRTECVLKIDQPRPGGEALGN